MKQVIAKIRNCTRCNLWSSRTHAVPGEGNLDADIMLIGEAPGRQEDLEGRPFVGAAGKLLTELLCTVGIERNNIFIGNILKCRPPGNRNPRADEISSCTPYLDTQIELIAPRVICPLGNFATAYIFKKYGLHGTTQISAVHGKVFKVGSSATNTCTDAEGEGLTIVPLYHPAAIIYNPKLREQTIKDLHKIVRS